MELRLTFREGGAFDFHAIFEQIKERSHHAHAVARESGQQAPVDVDLEQLPAYKSAREVERDEEEPIILSPIPTRPVPRTSSVEEEGISTTSEASNQPDGFTAPDEPPPGYEEAQAQAISIELEQRLRGERALNSSH